MAISSPGVGSNLDVNSIVRQLMAVEREPLNRLDTREVSFQARLSAYGSIRGALSQFQGAMSSLASAGRYQAASASSSDAASVSASAVGTATPGSYAVEVNALAQSQRLVAAGQATSSGSIGSGTLSFDFGTISGGTFDSTTGTYTGAGFDSSGSSVRTVTIDPESSSLAGIRDSINKAAIGVTASIVNDGGSSPFRLVLSVGQTGQANALKISVTGDAGLQSLLTQDPAGTQSLAETSKAQNAALTINGVAVTKASNTISDAIEGVTLTLVKRNVGTPTTVTVARDTASVQTAAQNFVKSYNDLSRTLTTLSAYNPGTRTAAVLNGDSGVRSLQFQLRALLGQPLSGMPADLRTMSDIGIAFQRDGSLAVDATKLSKAIEANPTRIAGVFAALGTTTDALVQFSSASAGVSAGSYALDVTQLATRGSSVGTAAAGLAIVAGGNDSLDLTVDGVATSITLAARTYPTAAALAAELQGRINGSPALAAVGAGVQVTVAGGVLSVTSNRFGLASTVAVNGGLALNVLFGGAPTRTDGVDVAGTVNGTTASGSGQTLTSDAGLQLRVLGGTVGSRGSLDYTIGFAGQLSEFAGKQISSDGLVNGRTSGINRSIADIGDQRTAMGRRLVDIERRYRAQFTALDVLIGNLSQTSNFINQQLATLNGSSNNRR